MEAELAVGVNMVGYSVDNSPLDARYFIWEIMESPEKTSQGSRVLSGSELVHMLEVSSIEVIHFHTCRVPSNVIS